MSYYKVNYISEKNQTLHLACNNVIPLDWFTTKPFKDRVSDKEFTTYIIDNVLDGNFHIYGYDNKYNVLADKIRNSELYKAIYKARDDNFDESLDIDFKHGKYAKASEKEIQLAKAINRNECENIYQARLDVIRSFI